MVWSSFTTSDKEDTKTRVCAYSCSTTKQCFCHDLVKINPRLLKACKIAFHRLNPIAPPLSPVVTCAKLLHYPLIGSRAGLVGFVAQLVCVDPCSSESFQSLSDGALPAPAASRQADHVWDPGESRLRL